MTIDIIALALKSGFVSRTYGDNSGEIAVTCVSNLTPLNSELQRYSELLVAEIRKEYEARITGLEDALDHIKKIAGMARVPTKRLDWIEARASMALLNEPWDKDYRPLPKNANSSRNTLRHLTEQNTKLMEALKLADEFISNGIEFGFIRMPDLDTPDSAHKTPGIIKAALTPQPEKEGK